MIFARVFLPQMLFFQQAEAESEIYCLFAKPWGRSPTPFSSHSLPGSSKSKVQEFRTRWSAFQAPVPGSTESPWFSWFCIYWGWSITAQSPKEWATFQWNRWTVNWDYGSLKPWDKPPKMPHVQTGTCCPQCSLQNIYSASAPSQTAEELCSVNCCHVIVTPPPFILLSAFIESHESPPLLKRKPKRLSRIDVPAIVQGNPGAESPLSLAPTSPFLHQGAGQQSCRRRQAQI